ncbi:MAG: epoxyqueuosine reductase [Armatimonadetes bacterium]|nr:epoxyqueuosine reductase [Armatimonadota bacterium]
MDSLTESIRRTALEAGADLVGFAPISRFDEAPESLHPRTVFPPVQTVIAIALRQPRGALKAVEEGAYWQAYNCDSYWYLNEVLAPQVLRRIVMTLEGEGYTSVPVHNPFHSHSGRQVREDQPHGPDGMVSLRVIGCAAGLGELGLSKLLLTPQFGPRQRVFAVFTDAELEPTPLFTGSVCDECGACARECEACAIGRSRDECFTIEGRSFGHASFDAGACAKVHQGMDPRFSPFWNGSEAEGAEPSYNRFCKDRFRHLAVCVGRGCIRACLDHLEKTGRIEARFRNPFIERPRWKLNEPPQKKKDGTNS